MDLAKAYHTFAENMYPTAIRIADRYHVNRYVTEALQAVRKFVQKQLSPFAKKDLKQHFRILGKRRDQLEDVEKRILHRLLRKLREKSTYKKTDNFVSYLFYAPYRTV